MAAVNITPNRITARPGEPDFTDSGLEEDGWVEATLDFKFVEDAAGEPGETVDGAAAVDTAIVPAGSFAVFTVSSGNGEVVEPVILGLVAGASWGKYKMV